MNICAFIFARGGSKGLPGKNIRLFGGKPLIASAIDVALKVDRIERVIVSTDSDEIAEIAVRYGAEVPFMRPSDLATDESPEIYSWRHALDYLKNSPYGMPDIMVSLPVTAPLRLPSDVDLCIDRYLRGGVDSVITVTEAYRNPYFNMVSPNGDGTLKISAQTNEIFSRRQDAPLVYDMATICYVINPNFALRHLSLFQGRVGYVTIPRERSIDIDSLYDFQIAEYLLKIAE